MEHLWIVAALSAAFFQSLRHAALKELNRHLSATVTTYVRMLFGLPMLALYLVAVMHWTDRALPALSPRFWFFCGITAVTQVVMTLLMVHLFRLGNLAVGVMLTKADVILTALIGSALFSERISGIGWIAIFLTLSGMVTASAGRLPATAWSKGDTSIADLLLGPAARLGLLAALTAAISYLALREAILDVDAAAGPLMRSALAGVAMTFLSFVLVGVWLLVTERAELARLRHWPGLCLFLGFVSAAGTIGWFTASALTNASYVAAVAHVQIVFVMLISRYWFKETIRPLEYVGIALILTGIVVFRLA